MKDVNDTHILTGIHQISNAKQLHDHLEQVRAKSIREKQVQEFHISTSREQLALISTLVEEQKRLRNDQTNLARQAKKSSDIQLWLNVFVVIISTLGFALSVFQYYRG